MDKLEVLEGVGEATSIKLKEAEYDTFDKIAKTKTEELSSKLGVNKELAIKIIESAKKEVKNLGSKELITLENFKIKKGILNHVYNGFKTYLKGKNDSKFDLKELEIKYKEFLNKKI